MLLLATVPALHAASVRGPAVKRPSGSGCTSTGRARGPRVK
jgi:hypothetical protein